MKILYDHQIFTNQEYGGVSRYFYELANQFSSNLITAHDVSLLFSDNYYISDKKIINHHNFPFSKKIKGKRKAFYILNKFNTILNMKKQNFDLFHPTYYDPYFLKYLAGKPFVLTVYDMIHEKFSDLFPTDDKISLHKKLLAKKAIKIIAISESTKHDLMNIFGIDESKIQVIYLGNSITTLSKTSYDLKIPKKYLLFVGNRDNYKNFSRLIESISSILKKNSDLFIICVGGGRFNDKEIRQFSDLNIQNQILQFNLEDKDLGNFYQNAIAFIFPSLYEGFGIPVLEAFSCGCPIICSNTSSLPEVAGQGACYFDPYSIRSIKLAVTKVIESPRLRKSMITKGYSELKKFSWEKTAKQTKLLYESLLY